MSLKFDLNFLTQCALYPSEDEIYNMRDEFEKALKEIAKTGSKSTTIYFYCNDKPVIPTHNDKPLKLSLWSDIVLGNRKVENEIDILEGFISLWNSKYPSFKLKYETDIYYDIYSGKIHISWMK